MFTNLTIGQTRALSHNIGKTVTVEVLSSTLTLTIHGGVVVADAFRYIMHTAKKPRKPFDPTIGLHSNIERGYYFVDPLNIIL